MVDAVADEADGGLLQLLRRQCVLVEGGGYLSALNTWSVFARSFRADLFRHGSARRERQSVLSQRRTAHDHLSPLVRIRVDSVIHLCVDNFCAMKCVANHFFPIDEGEKKYQAIPSGSKYQVFCHSAAERGF